MSSKRVNYIIHLWCTAGTQSHNFFSLVTSYFFNNIFLSVPPTSTPLLQLFLSRHLLFILNNIFLS